MFLIAHPLFYMFPSSTIPLKSEHTLYDVKTQIPTFFHITTASTYHSKAKSETLYETGSYYIFDRAYS